MAAQPSKGKDFIVVVSGLPRSGTSMMMQMLDAGGISVVTDDLRKPDEDNPKGYYEYEKVKDLEKDNSWLDIARGKAIKIVSPLLFHLKTEGDYRYKIIFMRRDLDEVLASQRKMADRLKREEDKLEDEKLKQHYIKHLGEIEEWMDNRENIEVVYVDYTDVIKDPLTIAEGICEFLDMDLDTKKMAQVVSDSLYRQRYKETGGSGQEAASAEEVDKEMIMDRLKSLGYL